MKRICCVQIACVVCVIAAAAWADVDSGPAVGNAVPELKVYAVTGEHADKEVTMSAERGDKPTVWMFVPKDMWNRPMARLMKDLDTQIKDVNDAQLVGVWLTNDQFTTKDYLPKAQQSIKLERSALTYYQGDPAGPADWGINPDAEVTVVVTGGGKIAATWGFVSVNETVAEQILTALKQAGDGT
jgi:hypothetical protein